MHAIDAGNLILEIQQNSMPPIGFTTGTGTDWTAGQELHTSRNPCNAIDFTDYEPSPIHLGGGRH